MRFLGNIEAKTDAKGRAFLPAVFRKVLQASGEERLMLRQHVHEKCLVIYPESVWNERTDMLRKQLSMWNKAQEALFRQFTSQAEEVTLDGNGRLLISKRLLQAAGIDQAIRFIGNDLKESIDGLNIKPNGTYVDVTFGGGGHSREILSRLGSKGHLYSFDQDADAEKNIVNDERFTFVRSNFRYLKNWMRYYDVDHIDGLLADLGVSSHHFDDETRGFSFRFNAPLDMRMNKRAQLTAAEVVNNYTEEQLAGIFYLYGELKNARKIAAALAKARSVKPIETTQDLIDATARLMGREREKKDTAKLFQALRIEVNHEMEALIEMLNSATELLGTGGRLSVITYHSLEDRIVKNMMKAGNTEGKMKQDFFGRAESPFTLVNNKVIVPGQDEQERNPRSRSAKLRIAEKK